MLCAVHLQDIAVDGWALTLLPPHHIEYASTCQTLGMNTGYFMSFTIFLALSSTEFCNKYIRSNRLAGGWATPGPWPPRFAGDTAGVLCTLATSQQLQHAGRSYLQHTSVG